MLSRSCTANFADRLGILFIQPLNKNLRTCGVSYSLARELKRSIHPVQSSRHPKDADAVCNNGLDTMALPNKKRVETDTSPSESEQIAMLKLHAVAIDPPPEGAIGIRELLKRFERFAAAGELSVASSDGRTAGVRVLLDRLGKLAAAGYFDHIKTPISNGD